MVSLAAWFGISQLFEDDFFTESELASAGDGEKRTALWWAAHRGHAGLAELLLNRTAKRPEADPSKPEASSLEEIFPSSVLQQSFSKALQNSIWHGDVTTVKMFLEFCAARKVSFELDDETHPSSLCVAIPRKNRPVIDLLLGLAEGAVPEAARREPSAKCGAKLEKRGESGRTPLADAIVAGLDDVVGVLIQQGADVDAQSSTGRTPLSLVIEAQAGQSGFLDPESAMPGSGPGEADDAANSGMLLSLLEHGANAALPCAGGQTPLLQAVKSGLISTVKLLLEHGADVEIRDLDGRTPLLEAVQAGDEQTVKTLLDYGAHIEAKDKDGQTSLLKAAAICDTEPVVEILLQHGAKTEARDHRGQTALLRAAKEGRESNVGILLSHGADTDVRDEDGRSPLWWAAAIQCDMTLEALLAHGADVEASDNFGVEPLTSCAQYYSPSGLAALATLARHGADVRPQKQGRALLIEAARDANVEFTRWLLESDDLDPHSADEDGVTPLAHAVQSWRTCQGNSASAFGLLVGDPRVGIPGPYSQWLLREAIREDAQDLLQCLLSREDVDVNAESDGVSHLQYAADCGTSVAFQALLDHGALIDGVKGIETVRTTLKRCFLSQTRYHLREWYYFKAPGAAALPS